MTPYRRTSCKGLPKKWAALPFWIAKLYAGYIHKATMTLSIFLFKYVLIHIWFKLLDLEDALSYKTKIDQSPILDKDLCPIHLCKLKVGSSLGFANRPFRPQPIIGSTEHRGGRFQNAFSQFGKPLTSLVINNYEWIFLDKMKWPLLKKTINPALLGVIV